MESGFGRKLFRLFLLFSLVPSAALALLGYYLTSETTTLQPTSSSIDITDLDDYFRVFWASRIDTAVNAYLEGRSPTASDLDFLMTFDDTIPTLLLGGGLVDTVDLDEIRKRVREQLDGMLETSGGVLQYHCRSAATNLLVCGGYLHDRSYAQLLQRMHTVQAGRSTSEDIRSRYLYFLAVLFALVGLVTVVVAYQFSSRLARSLSRPLARLSLASQEIAEGKFGRQVEPDGVGEVRDLIQSFNLMSERLEFTTTRLAQTERVAAWRSVAQRFAHELKNPLQPIMISLHRLEKMLRDSSHYSEAAEPLRAATEELKHLVNLADRFSQLAKLPAPRPETVDLKELLSSIATLYCDLMDRYRFEVELPDQSVTATLDVTYFREALHNLLQNAADASVEGGLVRLALVESDDRIDIIVEDQGAGMSPETIRAARMPYFTTKEKGKGLGLAIVEKVVTESGGRLFIESREGSGTKITITLRREKESHAGSHPDH